MSEQFCKAGEVELCFETFGERGSPALLLVMGLGTQMIGWHEDFCRALAERGFFVIRYDNRDCGRSTHFNQVRPPKTLRMISRRPGRLAYTLEDMAGDGIGILDHLGIEQAHVTGASMGGMIAQVMAARHPERVLSLVSIMSTTGSQRVGRTSARVYPFLMGRAPKDRAAHVARLVKLFGVIGSPGFERDQAQLREMAGLSFDRASASGTAGMLRQLAAIVGAGNRTADLRRIQAPTLVIHGAADPMIAPSGGRATARAIPGARLLVIEGMGHDLPRDAWPQIIDGIVQNVATVRDRVPS